MYAVFESGGKQHRVSAGDVLKLEKLESSIGDVVEFDKVLMVANDDQVKLGAPFLDGSKVIAEVIAQGRHKKIHILKFRRRKHHMKRQGHRQYFTQVKVTGIQA